ncbi:CLUMA_CG018866, isoform A [Clunio marinus]|uniref:CLUMA_CG018866, isoform A n=1 Tax=Clunio marinus TaxID=568069 RepID=A0A1J1J0B4_9DIPT|nr:CLUMA_CG018866, isoform A [Clunio marinus]
MANILKERSPYSNSLHRKTRGWNRTLLLTGIATTIGSANVAGYNIGVINAPSQYIKEWANETIYKNYDVILNSTQLDLLWSFIVSIFLVGGAVGSLGGSYIADRIGRKGSYLTCAVLFIIGSISFHSCRTFSSVELLIFGRVCVGLASGITTTCLPMYLSEIAPLHLRGTLGVFCSMGVTGGVVVGQVVSLQEIFGTPDLWHYCLSFQLVFLIIFTLPYRMFPESPKYLCLIASDRTGALRELKKLCDDQNMADEEFEAMEPSNQTSEEQRGVISVLRDHRLLLPLILVCSMQGGQQMSGINAVFYYSVSIFQSIGFSSTNAKWANLAAGCLNLFVSFFSPVLMERVNRRPLMLTSCCGCAVFLFLLSIFYSFAESLSILPAMCVFAMLGYILVYQIGLGPIPYFCGSELFEVGPRPVAMSMGSLSSWFCNFTIAMTFPTLQTTMGASVFLIFSLVCLSLTIFLKFYMPETRGKSTSEVARLVDNGFKSRPLEVNAERVNEF